jgi:DNA-directed RNA polymerase subunit RPC12/RpoP
MKTTEPTPIKLRIKFRWTCPHCKHRLSLANFYPEHLQKNLFGQTVRFRHGLCYHCWKLVDLIDDRVGHIMYVPISK